MGRTMAGLASAKVVRARRVEAGEAAAGEPRAPMGAFFCTDAMAEAARRRAAREREAQRRAGSAGAAGEAAVLAAAADGAPAMRARPIVPAVLAGDPRIGRERSVVARCADAHVIDRMWARGQLDDRRHTAASRLYGLFVRAGLEPRCVAEPGQARGGGSGGDLDDATAEARAEYNRLLRGLPPGRGAELCDALMHGQHPGTFGLEALAAALDRLARGWRLPRRGHGGS